MKPSASAALPFREERTAHYPEQLGLTGFRELVHVRFTDACPPLSSHVHPDAIELCYITKGSQIYAVGGHRYRIGAGMAYISYPNEPHSTDALQQEKGVELYYMIIDTVNAADRFLGLSGADGPRLTAQLNGLERCFHVGMELKRRLDEMLFLLADRPDGFELLLRCHTCLMIHELARASLKPQPTLTPDVCQALQFIEEHLGDAPPDVAQMADCVHLSVPRFKQKFRSQIGLPPAAYQQRRRIEVSCELLSGGASVTRTAHEMGFSSSQHFATIFRRHMGISPLAWKKERLNGRSIEKDL